MKSKLERFQSRLEELRKKRFNASKIKQYHSREMNKAVIAGELKEYEKHSVKHQFHDQRLKSVRIEILALKEKIRGEEARIQEEEYREKVRAFEAVMVKKLSGLQAGLDLLVTEYKMTDIATLSNELYDWFVLNSKGIRREDLAPFNQFGMLSQKVRIGNIIDTYGRAQTITAVSSPSISAGLRGKVKLFSQQLSSQISDCLTTVRSRNVEGGHGLWLRKSVMKLKSLVL